MFKQLLSFCAVAALVAVQPALADTLVLDTGTPSGSGFPMTLDGSDFVAAKFHLDADKTITGVQAYLNAGLDSSGATFTFALYSNDTVGGLFDRFGGSVYSAQGTYSADGWTGLTGLNWSGLGAGDYWLALEVGATDSASGLSLPSPASGGTAAALAYAFNAGSGYQTSGAQSFGAQVSTVPVPGAVWLLGSGLAGLAGLRRKRALTDV
jgi:hypothetical protein